LAHFENLFAQVNPASHIILLPEMFTTSFSMNAAELAEDENGPTISWMREQALKHRKIIGGSIIFSENEKYYNRFIWMQPDGKYLHYDKRHLFALAAEEKTFTAGDQKVVVQVNGLKICYDLRFPVWCRQEKNNHYDVLVFVANWPAVRTIAWDSLLQARAIENQCYVIGVNRIGTDGTGKIYTGHSQAIDPLGNIVAKDIETESITMVTIEKKNIEKIREQIPFLEDGDEYRISR
jgi:omega-amidase